VGGHQVINVELQPSHQGWRLDRALADAVPTLSRERLKALIRSGALESLGAAAVRDPALKVRGGEAFLLTVPEPAPAHNEPQDIPLRITFEDEHLLVVDKPAGLVVHPAAGNPDGTLVNALLHHCGGSLSGIGGVARPGIVHRIDKDTSGLLVVAKTDVAHEGLAKQFAAHSIERRYLAVVNGIPKAAEVKCIVRDKIGSFKERSDMETWLNNWVGRYVENNPATATEADKARKPLAGAEVIVEEVEGNPGYYRSKFFLRPHYQLEGLTVSLRLVSKLPSAKA
jgi:23S rRNA-/tRNA-specific pseudouridylate synthase